MSYQEHLVNYLVVQWLGPCAFTAEGPGSIHAQGTKIPQATQSGQKKKRKEHLLRGTQVTCETHVECGKCYFRFPASITQESNPEGTGRLDVCI